MANVNGQIDDLAKLIDLDDQIILQELKDRYERNVIYVSIKNKKLSSHNNDSLKWRVGVMVFNATFNNISVIYRCGQFFLMVETRVPGENHRPVAS